MKRIVLLLLAGLLSAAAAHADEGRLLPIQHSGRVKTFDAFARETLTLVHGRTSWQKRTAADWLYDAAADPPAARSWKWIRVDYRPLADALSLPTGRHHFSFEEIVPSADKIESLGRSAEKKRDLDETPSLLERKAESLYAALIVVRDTAEGSVFRVVPPTQGSADPVWHAPGEASPEISRQFTGLASARGSAAFEEQARAWNRRTSAATGGRHDRALTLEAFYFNLRPFALAAGLFFVGFLCLVGRRLPGLARTGAVLVAGGFALQSLGLVLRVLILERPPVSNMYESIVWMSWVLVLASFILSLAWRDLAAAAVGSIAGAIVMIYGNLLPIDTGLDVLVPVLRSNYWLTIHVLTIVSSYGVFGLAMGLGHRHLWLHARGRLHQTEEDRSAHLIYRTILLGVLLVGIGTVLGGVCANESWGRFWGWDPKETWALISLLGYLVLIHLHYARIVKPFSLAVGAIGGFLLVLFTWYGVNFVLGKGLHSYGQGSGGMNWVLLYLVAEALFAVWVFLQPQRRKRVG